MHTRGPIRPHQTYELIAISEFEVPYKPPTMRSSPASLVLRLSFKSRTLSPSLEYRHLSPFSPSQWLLHSFSPTGNASSCLVCSSPILKEPIFYFLATNMPELLSSPLSGSHSGRCSALGGPEARPVFHTPSVRPLHYAQSLTIHASFRTVYAEKSEQSTSKDALVFNCCQSTPIPRFALLRRKLNSSRKRRSSPKYA